MKILEVKDGWNSVTSVLLPDPEDTGDDPTNVCVGGFNVSIREAEDGAVLVHNVALRTGGVLHRLLGFCQLSLAACVILWKGETTLGWTQPPAE